MTAGTLRGALLLGGDGGGAELGGGGCGERGVRKKKGRSDGDVRQYPLDIEQVLVCIRWALLLQLSEPGSEA